MTTKVGSIQCDGRNIEYRLIRRQRRTLEIAVEPNGSVVVVAPIGASQEAIEAKLRRRALWVLRQQRYFSQFLPRTPERKFISGETHRYLGRQYRLRVIPQQQEYVELSRDHIIVHTYRQKRPQTVRNLVRSWFRERAHAEFPKRLEVCLGQFPEPEAFRPRGVIIRQLNKRWGSLSPAGRLLLNCRLIEAPVDSIDYVITHELCHMAQPHHGADFFELLEQVMPDWERRKEKLERVMA